MRFANPSPASRYLQFLAVLVSLSVLPRLILAIPAAAMSVIPTPSRSFIPMATTSIISAPLKSGIPVAPYAPGTCHVHVHEYDTTSDGDFYEVEAEIFDNSGNSIGKMDRTAAGNDNPAYMPSKLEDKLEMQCESENDYIHFNIGKQTWESFQNDNTKIPYCYVQYNAWDTTPQP